MRFLAILFVVADLHSRIYGFVSFASAGITRNAFKSSQLHLSPVDDISLGAPYSKPLNGAYISAGGVKVDVEVEDVTDPTQTISDMVDMIDNHKGDGRKLLSVQTCFYNGYSTIFGGAFASAICQTDSIVISVISYC